MRTITEQTLKRIRGESFYVYSYVYSDDPKTAQVVTLDEGGLETILNQDNVLTTMRFSK